MTVDRLRRVLRWLWLRPWLVVLVLVTSGQVVSWLSLEAEVDARCRTLIRAIELVGEETQADPADVERFIHRLNDETDC